MEAYIDMIAAAVGIGFILGAIALIMYDNKIKNRR